MKIKKIISLLFIFSLCFGTVTNSNIIISQAKKKVKLSKKKTTIEVNEVKTITLKNTKKKVKWSTSNKKIAVIDRKYGKYKRKVDIRGKKAGRVTITAKCKGKKYKCKVIVKRLVNKTKTNKTTTNKETNVSKNTYVNAKLILPTTPTTFYSNFDTHIRKGVISNVSVEYSKKDEKTCLATVTCSGYDISDKKISLLGLPVTIYDQNNMVYSYLGEYYVDSVFSKKVYASLEAGKTYYLKFTEPSYSEIATANNCNLVAPQTYTINYEGKSYVEMNNFVYRFLQYGDGDIGLAIQYDVNFVDGFQIVMGTNDPNKLKIQLLDDKDNVLGEDSFYLMSSYIQSDFHKFKKLQKGENYKIKIISETK